MPSLSSSNAGPLGTDAPSQDRSWLADHLLAIAQRHVAERELQTAATLVADIVEVVDGIDRDVVWAERSMLLGELQLALEETHRARERFEEAAVILDGHDRAELLARCLFGLGRAMTMVDDPVGRTILEDAGSLFEELGDETSRCAVEVELRHLAAGDDESGPSLSSARAIITVGRC